MSDARWRDVQRNLTSAERNIAFAITVFEADELRSGTYAAERSRQAFMHALQTGYTSIETAFRRTLAILGEAEPTGPDWHRSLLERIAEPIPGSRPALVGLDLYAALNELLRFRHVAMHAYDSFEPERAASAVSAARSVFPALSDQIGEFRRTIDPDDTGADRTST